MGPALGFNRPGWPLPPPHRFLPYRAVRRLQVENGPGFLVIRAEGFRDSDPIHTKLSASRRFLEFVFQRSVHILAPGTRMMAPRIVRTAARSDAA